MRLNVMGKDPKAEVSSESNKDFSPPLRRTERVSFRLARKKEKTV